MPSQANPSANRSSAAMTAWRHLCELVAAWGIAVTQPLLNLLGPAPDYFITYGLSPRDVKVFLVALALLVPVAVWFVEIAFVRAPRIRHLIHTWAVGSFLTLFVAQIVKITLGINGVLYVVLTCVVGTVVVAAYLWRRFLREWLVFVAVVPVLSVSLFLFSSPAGRYATASTGAARSGHAIDAPVVILMLDEFPVLSLLNGTGEIDSSRYPNFARLESLTNWYRNYSTTAEVTHFAIPAALSGVYPQRGLGSTYVDHPDTIFSLVGANHEMNVWESITRLCSPSVCKSSPIAANTQSADWKGLLRGLRQVFRQRIDTTKKNEMNVFAVEGAQTRSTTTEESTTTSAPTTAMTLTSKPSPSTTTVSKLPGIAIQNYLAATQAATFEKWLQSLNDSATPQMSYLHMLLPHQPWIFLPNGMTYATDEPESQPGETAWEARVKQQRHQLQVEYLDSLIGQLLDRLEATNLLDKALFVVAADHGVSFTAGYNRRFVTGDFANYPSIMHVPLFIHFPGQKSGKVIDDNVENVDVLPIIAKQLGFTIPWKVDGVAPDDKDAARRASKSLLFVSDPLSGPKRAVPSMTVDFETFVKETMTAGFTASDVANNELQFLYSGAPHARLRFTRVDSMRVTTGKLSLVLDSDVARQNPQVLVRGVVSGNVSLNDTFAFARDGVILGVSPVISRDGENRVVSLLEPPSSSTPSTLTVYRVVDDGTLEAVSVGK